MKLLIYSFLFVFFCPLFAQNKTTFLVLDAENKEALIGVNILIESINTGTVTDINGIGILDELPVGKHIVLLSYIGYEAQNIKITVPISEEIEVLMIPASEGLEEVVVTSNRANRSVSTVPTRIEVLTDEVEEAATMDPSKIAHLLMHTTGIQVQQTSATSGSASVRIQGQYGRYTQILKDGFPIYGGFTGGLGVLQIPPLDLKQVEFIKGSSSTLYGGGAIAGLINLISKEPGEESEFSLHLNLSHIGNTDLNSFYSQKSGKWGVTVFTSNNTNTVYDVDEDGFSDVPQVRKFNFNPKVFYYLDDKTTLSFGGTFTNENRIGGDVQIVQGFVPDSLHNYFERNKSQQITTQFKADRKLNKSSAVEFKNSTNRFNRNIYLNNYAFAGTQFSTFSELNYSFNRGQHNVVAGLNLYTEQFEEKQISTSNLRDQQLTTVGIFGQHIWDINRKFSLETGLRTDFNTDYGLFVLPRMAFIYKPSLRFTARVSGGLGYKLPSIFTEDAEGLAFENVLPINKNIHEAERSYGGNADFTFRLVSTEKLSISLTEFVFYNRLNKPLLLIGNQNNDLEFINGSGYFETKGVESMIKASAGPFNLYLGYTYVDALRNQNSESISLPLTPQHSFHGDLMFIVEGVWRVGLDAEYESEQILSTGRQVQSLFKAGFLAERMFNNLSVYINLENWTDTRQTRYESLIQAPFTNPRFTEVWAPLDGFIFNLGLKLKL